MKYKVTIVDAHTLKAVQPSQEVEANSFIEAAGKGFYTDPKVFVAINTGTKGYDNARYLFQGDAKTDPMIIMVDRAESEWDTGQHIPYKQVEYWWGQEDLRALIEYVGDLANGQISLKTLRSDILRTCQGEYADSED